ncbi:M24 family metallopeptidase [Euzebya tangerina]|uniref:M24 family metallopeptidase n=1 Tax=Euzebya tangerina TaxID=591198 RepID=UPI000E3151D3|nr:Xaa-Pro peptidase family protein [Euzebya tangerina]
MRTDHADRTRRLQAAMVEEEVPALLVTNLINVRWLTGFTGTAGRAYVTATGPALLVVDDRYTERAQDEAPAAELVTDRTAGWLLERHDPTTPLGVEADHMTWADVTRLGDLEDGPEPQATTKLISTLRQVKDEAEISLIQQACELTARAFEDALSWLEPGLTERQIARRLIDTLIELGAEGSAFAPIVAAGPNGSRPHHDPSDRAVRAGELITMDFGAKVDGYHADMTRTVALGPPRSELAGIHQLVRDAQAQAADAALDGVETSDVDGVCRTIIDDAGHGDHFAHGTGHGVGLQIHEDPFLGRETTGTLRRGMTITVEPGVYLPGAGGVRIEDVVLVTDSGPERLTTANRELITL